MAVNPNMANREVADLVLLDYKTKKVFLPIDFANVTTTDFTANRVQRVARAHRTALALIASVQAP